MLTHRHGLGVSTLAEADLVNDVCYREPVTVLKRSRAAGRFAIDQQTGVIDGADQQLLFVHDQLQEAVFISLAVALKGASTAQDIGAGIDECALDSPRLRVAEFQRHRIHSPPIAANNGVRACLLLFIGISIRSGIGRSQTRLALSRIDRKQSQWT